MRTFGSRAERTAFRSTLRSGAIVCCARKIVRQTKYANCLIKKLLLEHHLRVEYGPTINDARVSAKYPLGGEVNSTDVTVVVVQDSGHWIMEEQPKKAAGGR